MFNDKSGTEVYNAPEKNYQYPFYQGEPADIFSAGVILFIMYTKSLPFKKAIKTDGFYKYLAGGRPEYFFVEHQRVSQQKIVFPYALKSLLNAMFHPDPLKRPTIE